MALYGAILTLHVLFSSVTIGATVAYAGWISLAERHPEHLAFTIRSVRRSDRILAIPAYLLTFVTGIALSTMAPIPLERPWLLASIVLYLAVLAVGFGVFGPVVRRELAALERGGIDDPDYRGMRGRALALSLGTIVALVAILALMVLRPR